MPRVALIGDFNPGVVAHRAIPPALDLAARHLGGSVTWDWVGTDKITDAPRQLAGHAGVWCVPGSPYRRMEGALAAIRFARETNLPFLGTCGGFQHALVEIARNVLGIEGADHAETAPAVSAPSKSAEGGRVEGPQLVVTPLACALVGQHGEVTFTPGSQLHAIFHGQSTREGYHCSYGLNPDYRTRFEATGLRFTGFDADHQIRALELHGHPFFIGTLFQPERAAIAGRSHPLIEAFVAQLHEP
jgi:CTP synthase (UTP-ammonia lyase)